MDSAIEQRERDKWNQRYLEGTHGTLPPDSLLIQAFDRYGGLAVRQLQRVQIVDVSRRGAPS
ncbi:MAG: hypothetical protein ACJ71S_03125 [Acidobacteriaceae bacterium]